jgi:predicted transcriptional regulator
MTYDIILDALGDATRRRIVEALRMGPMAVVELTATQEVSRPAVSQHLKVLENAGLVQSEAQGARRIYAIRREALVELQTYLDGFWDQILDAYSIEIQRKFRN